MPPPPIPTRRLFGTDGVRGVAGELVTAELALALARAATQLTGADRARVLIVRDTRESGEMLQAAAAAGVSAAGGEALVAGVLPTPAAPLLIERYGLRPWVVLSASHNPYQDNGIKFFGGDGYKLSDEAELQIERALAVDQPGSASGDRARARAARRRRGLPARAAHALRRARSRWAARWCWTAPMALRTDVAPEIFRRLGASVTAIADSPDGRNINADCGSTHVDELARRLPAGGPRGGLRVRRRR